MQSVVKILKIFKGKWELLQNNLAHFLDDAAINIWIANAVPTNQQVAQYFLLYILWFGTVSEHIRACKVMKSQVTRHTPFDDKNISQAKYVTHITTTDKYKMNIKHDTAKLKLNRY